MKPRPTPETSFSSGTESQNGSRALIELRQVVKIFYNAAGEFPALRGIDAAFRKGEFVSIVGRSGSGKSTLLNMMTGIDHPTSGEVRIGDAVLHRMNEGQMSIWRGRNMGIVFQFFQLLPMLTLLENVMLPMDFGGVYKPADREQRAVDLLALVGLDGLENKYPAAVSGGQQQSAAVARALANDPPILVADEPTGNLDSVTAERVLEIFEAQVARGKTILMVTHDSSLARRAQRMMVIADGEMIDEAISGALPALPHDVLLAMHHAAQRKTAARGEVLEPPPGGLLIVAKGTLEAVVGGRWGTQVVAERLGPGALFSAEDSRALGRRLAGLRAVGADQDSAVELLWLADMPPSTELRQTLDGIASQRADRYAAAGRQRGQKGLVP